MDRREPPRVGTADAHPPGVGEDGPPRRPARRLDRLAAHPAARRLAVSRVGRAALAFVAAAGLAVAGGAGAWRVAREWLHRQPTYQVRFRDIELVPSPPPWIEGGREGLLEEVRAGRKALEAFSILDVDLDALLNDFRLNPWVVDASAATREHPNRLSVHLSYREPVAEVQVKGGARYTVDGDATVLPRQGIDPAHAGRLATIVARRPPAEPRAGLTWPAEATGEALGTSPSRSPAPAAARLAAMFKANAAPPSIAPDFIFANDRFANGRPYLLVRLADGTYVLWSDLDAPDDARGRSDLEKWTLLRAELERVGGPRARREDEYLSFDRDGVRVHRFRSDPARPDP